MSTPSIFSRGNRLRFWVHYRGTWVRLSLSAERPEIRTQTFSADEEGSFWTRDAYSVADGQLVNDWAEGGRDCDGRQSRAGRCVCAFDALEHAPAYDPAAGADRRWDNSAFHQGLRILRPDWQQPTIPACHDEYAAAAGY